MAAAQRLSVTSITSVIPAAVVLPHCKDPPPEPPSVVCEKLEHADEVGTVLCPRIATLQRLPCAQLADVTAVAGILGGANMSVLVASANVTRQVDFSKYYSQKLFTGLYMPGIVHEPSELAAMLVDLAGERSVERHASAPLRLAATNANNGWSLCLAAAYLRRVHGAPLVGLALNGLKTEWATNRNVRILLEQLSLSWRSPTAFEAAADAALLTYFPHVRNSLTPTTFAPARTLLPVGWVGTPPPFDVCMRFGEYDRAALVDDIQLVGGACRVFAYYGATVEAADAGGGGGGGGGTAAAAAAAVPLAADHDSAELGAAFLAAEKAWCDACFSARPYAHDAAQHVGRFVVRRSNHLRPAGSDDFHFVNKTPPAHPSLYAPACMQDMAGCDWHRGVVRHRDRTRRSRRLRSI